MRTAADLDNPPEVQSVFRRHAVVIASVVVSVGVLLTAIMVPLSFSYIERGHYGFKKNAITNDVDMGQVYTNGRYFWGLGKTAVTFPATYQMVDLTQDGKSLSVFIDGGFSINVDCVFFYRIVPDLLADLYRAFGPAYHEQVVAIAKAELRNIAPAFSIEQYVSQRANVSDALHTQLQKTLRRLAFVDVPKNFFVLQKVDIPTSVTQQKLTIFKELQLQVKELFQREASLIRLNTETDVKRISNEENIVNNNASATAQRIRVDAVSRAFADVERSKGQLLRAMLVRLGITGAAAVQKVLELDAMLAKKSFTLLSGTAAPLITVPSNNRATDANTTRV